VDVEIVVPPQGEASSALVLAGPNGGGKSSLLEIISYAIASSYSYSYGWARSFGDHSFEVDMGLTADEARLIDEWLTQSGQRPNYPVEELQQLARERGYTRYFNSAPTDSNTQARHDRAHNIVLNALRQQYGRPVGFSLPADRSYPASGFEPQKLLNQQDWQQRTLNAAFQQSAFQYRDMLDFLIERQYHFLRQLGQHHLALEDGTAGGHKPVNPITPYNELLQRLLPDYALTPPPGDGPPSNLWIKIPGGEVLPFSDLSSGEKEVFFVLANFIRQDVANAIVIVDEPELHLHPELGRRLVRMMIDVKPGNQLWLATHNPEIFDEVGADRTFFVARESGNATVKRASDAENAEKLLKEMFGFSGYIGVGRSLVFLEGEVSSIDRKLFSRLFGPDMAGVKLVPAGGVETVGRINSAVLQIIESGLARMSFYAIRDRDYLTDAEVAHYDAHASGRFRVLRRCHIENYLLDEVVMSKVLRDIYERDLDEATTAAMLAEVAQDMSAEVLVSMVGFKLQRLTWAEDFNRGSTFKGVSLFQEGTQVADDRVQAIQAMFRTAATQVREENAARVSDAATEHLVAECQAEVESWLAATAPGQTWRERFPGKRLIEQFAKKAGVQDKVAFHNQLILGLAQQAERVPEELSRLMATVRTGEPFQ
jgi:energy-coupling factor transporter ATP-binding protein EcfA2